MAFRVKIVSPIKIDEADLKRRQVRYGEAAGPGTHIEVFNLPEGPTTLDTVADLVFCEYAVFQQGANTRADKFDAILIDCVFDPAVDSLRGHTGLPTFGPMRTTLSLVPLVAKTFSVIARSEKQCELLTDLLKRYGYGDALASTRALGISYAEARKSEVFTQAMKHQIKNAIDNDGARAIVMGSTTMALSDELIQAANGVPLFMPGMFTLRVMESMWNEGLLRKQS
jgi:allantoin racemase